MGEHILSWMTFFPVVGAVVILFVPSSRKNLIRTVAAVAAAVPLLLAIQLFIGFDRGTAAMQIRSAAPGRAKRRRADAEGFIGHPP